MAYYWLYGMAGGAVLVAGIAAIGLADGASWSPAKASVSYIDRKCTIITTKFDGDYKATSQSSRTDDCNSIDEWEKVRKTRSKAVDGTAILHLSYTDPKTGQSESGELKFDGRDDEFYRINAGDEIAIEVSKDDPTRIRKA
jgi:hypothetical protein